MNNCFVCENRFARVPVIINGNNPRYDRRVFLAQEHRQRYGLQDIAVQENSLLCINCSNRINQIMELADNPAGIHFEVIVNRRGCFCCERNDRGLIEIPIETRNAFFYRKNQFISPNTRCCRRHILANEFSEEVLQRDFISLPQNVIIQGNELTMWLQTLRLIAVGSYEKKFSSEMNMNDEEMKILTSLNKNQFGILYEHCQPSQVFILTIFTFIFYSDLRLFTLTLSPQL